METNLYETDFYAWTERQADLLKKRRFAEVDIANVAEELEAMGRSEKRQFVSRLAQLLMHLLKWVKEPERRTNSWKYSIRNQRHGLAKLLKESPSLKHAIESRLAEAYDDALKLASVETCLDESAFPATCPYTFDQVMDNDFWPEF